MNDTERMERSFRLQADACGQLGSPMYARLLTSCADDIRSGGVVREVLRGHEQVSGPSALALRLLGSVHRMVLAGEAPELEPYYPSVGGRDDPGVWPYFLRVLERLRDRIEPMLAQAPQTNEVGRASALLGGLLHVAAEHDLPVRLREIGSSAGLNLLAERFRYQHESGEWWGPPDSPVQMTGAWRGPCPPLEAPLRVVERLGTDIAPLDVSTPDGARALLSYVWPDMAERFTRIQGALAIGAEHPVTVQVRDAVSAVHELDLLDGHVTVLWHSVMWQYLDHEQQEVVRTRISALGQEARAGSPFVHLFLEPTRRTPDSGHEFLVVMHTWPRDDRRIVGVGAPHGIPTRWEL